MTKAALTQTKFLNHEIPGADAIAILELGDHLGWNIGYLGNAPIPDQPTHVEEWWLVPAHLDRSQIPGRAMHRIQTVFERGLRPKGFVVVHEAPGLLCAPSRTGIQSDGSHNTPMIERKPVDLAAILGGLATSISTIFVFALQVLVPSLVIGLAMIDPILVAVMEDGSWIELDRWSDPV